MATTDPVEQQVGAFNAHDLECFLACFADAVVVTTPDGRVQIDGKAAMRQQYEPMFGSADARADILGRLRAGSWAVDHERVSRGQRSLEVLVGYELANDHIVRMVTFR